MTKDEAIQRLTALRKLNAVRAKYYIPNTVPQSNADALELAIQYLSQGETITPLCQGEDQVDTCSLCGERKHNWRHLPNGLLKLTESHEFKSHRDHGAGLAADLTIPDPARPYRQAARVGVSVECGICHRMKKPIGRSAALEAANGYCDDECEGYRKAPFVGSLWPGEHSDDFGYPVSEDGSIPSPVNEKE